MKAIIDTGFWYAFLDVADQHNSAVVNAVSEFKGKIILPVPAITEVAYLVNISLGPEALAKFCELLTEVNYEWEVPTSDDLLRVAEIIRKYNDNNIDFVDACIVAMAERLKISTILTVDHRHFRSFIPKHLKSFDLLPESL